MKPKETRGKLERRNLLLSTIRNINLMLFREKDRTRLLQSICDNLVESRGYHNAWIVLLDDARSLKKAMGAGLGSNFALVLEFLKRGDLPDCARRALGQPGAVITPNPYGECKTCPLAGKYVDQAGMTVRLAYRDKLYGVLTVSVPRNMIEDLEEPCLVEEIGEDIGFALYGLDLEESRQKADDALRETISELTERNKELNCLYAISRLIERRRYSLEEVLQGAVETLPSAWRYPEITCARILLEDRQYRTENFSETRWKQAAGIIVNDRPAGELEVCYLESKPEEDEGPFLREERSLIDAVAERLGKTIERRRTETALLQSEKRFRDLVENALTGISIVQDNQVIYQNQEQERLLGPLPRSSILGDLNSIHPDDVAKVTQLSRDISTGRIRKLEVDFRLLSPKKEKDRGSQRWIFCRAVQINYHGREAILVNMVDMTKTMELEQLVINQDKMASLGRVAAGIAHEIRNPLSGINIYLNTLEKFYNRPDSQPKVEQILSQIKSASKKIESVIRRVMDFAKPGEPNFALMHINQPVEEALNLTAVTMRKSGIRIERDLAEALRPCYADSHLIEVIVLNLLNNAAEAMKKMDENKKIAVSTGIKNDHLYIKVSDSGPGVPLDIRDKIFDPFFTTKNDGTGIGLSLCQRILADHRGSLTVADSELGGAEFCVEIPVKKPDA